MRIGLIIIPVILPLKYLELWPVPPELDNTSADRILVKFTMQMARVPAF